MPQEIMSAYVVSNINRLGCVGEGVREGRQETHLELGRDCSARATVDKSRVAKTGIHLLVERVKHLWVDKEAVVSNAFECHGCTRGVSTVVGPRGREPAQMLRPTNCATRPVDR